jgi:RNA methyltransferase, TrmH family
MMIERITSFSNEKLKYIGKLKSKSFRDEKNEFTIEGYRELNKSLLLQSLEYRSLFISPDCFLGENEDALISEFQKRRVKVFEMNKDLFAKISYRDRPDGLLAVAKIPDFRFLSETFQPSGDILIIEGVEKPGNLGTILRTAEGAGISSVIVSDPRIDLFNPNVIRSSTGTLFTIQVLYGDLESIIKTIRAKKLPIYGITPEAKKFYFQKDLKSQAAFLFGSEQYGITKEGKQLCDDLLSIPMKGNADSLNLAMSVGIIIYDRLRQRMV